MSGTVAVTQTDAQRIASARRLSDLLDKASEAGIMHDVISDHLEKLITSASTPGAAGPVTPTKEQLADAKWVRENRDLIAAAKRAGRLRSAGDVR